MDITQEVLSIARQYLRKVGKSGNENIMAICPFHRKSDGTEERDPSFSMSLTKGVYFCHGCHEKGTLKKFLQQMGLDGSAITLHYGIVLDEVGKNFVPLELGVQPSSIFSTPPLDDAVLGLFDHDVCSLLPSFSEATLKHFELGWDGWWKRITFPVRDIKGDLVAISGRAVYEGQEPRYKVYEDEYRAWDLAPRIGWKKSTVLWQMDKLYPELLLSPGDPTANYVAVVEGFKAAMWLWECGYKNVVAMLGSYMSEQQRWILESLGCRVYFFLDNNRAGWDGRRGAAQRLYKSNHVHIVEYPERLADVYGAQPDDLEYDELVEQMTNAPWYHHWRFGSKSTS